MSENLADINNITDLKNLFNVRSQGGRHGTVSKIRQTLSRPVRKLERAEAWLRRFRLAVRCRDPDNVYAICTASKTLVVETKRNMRSALKVWLKSQDIINEE